MTDRSETHTAEPVTGRADPLLEALRGVLIAGMESGSQDGIDSIPHRVGATLYSLLLDHAVDQRASTPPAPVDTLAAAATSRSPPLVLVHPDTPERRVLLAGERYDVALPWPPGIHRATGTFPLPPTMPPAARRELDTTDVRLGGRRCR